MFARCGRAKNPMQQATRPCCTSSRLPEASTHKNSSWSADCRRRSNLSPRVAMASFSGVGDSRLDVIKTTRH